MALLSKRIMISLLRSRRSRRLSSWDFQHHIGNRHSKNSALTGFFLPSEHQTLEVWPDVAGCVGEPLNAGTRPAPRSRCLPVSSASMDDVPLQLKQLEKGLISRIRFDAIECALPISSAWPCRNGSSNASGSWATAPCGVEITATTKAAIMRRIRILFCFQQRF
jgi:hypothetical protein